MLSFLYRLAARLVEVLRQRRMSKADGAISPDLGGEDGGAKLRAPDRRRAWRRWSTDYRRGLRDLDLAEPELMADQVSRNLAGYGPLEPLRADNDAWEIMVNALDGMFHGPHENVLHPLSASA